MRVTRFTMFTDTDRPVYFTLDEMRLSKEPGYSDIPWLPSIEGLGDMRSTVLTTKTTNGERRIGKSSPARNLVVHLIFPPGWDPKNFRNQLYDYWNIDLAEEHTFRLEFGDWQYTTRYIDGSVESVEPDIFAKVPMIHISILCPDPNYYRYPDAPLFVDGNGEETIDNNGTPSSGWWKHTFNTTVETGFEITLLPGVNSSNPGNSPTIGNNYTNVSVSCYTHRKGVQTFAFDTAGASFGQIRGGDEVLVDTTPGSVRIILKRGGAEHNLLPYTDITNGIMRVMPTVQEYWLKLTGTGSPAINARATCRELYVGV